MYWKTSTFLWESKLKELSKAQKVVIPINWPFHCMPNKTYDFGIERAETDLFKLVSIIKHLGLEPIFLISLTPIPFIPNGGTPFQIAREKSLDENGVLYTLLDSENNIIHLHSFFDTVMYQNFRVFIENLSNYLSEKNINIPIWGGIGGYLKNNIFNSYLIDRSPAFHQAFSRFVSVKKKDSGDLDIISTPQKEISLINEFNTTIQQLYTGTCEEFLSEHWENSVQISFLGGSPKETFSRLVDCDICQHYSDDLFTMITNNIIPSSILIPKEKQDDILIQELDEIVTNTIIPTYFQTPDIIESDQGPLVHLELFQLYETQNNKQSIDDYKWTHYGLLPFLSEHFNNTFKLKSRVDNQFANNAIYSFIGEEIDLQYFRTILKLFMNGSQVIIDSYNMAPEIKRKFETFFIENSINITKVTFHCEIINCSLGEGKLLLFNGKDLTNIPQNKLKHFWMRLITTLNIIHLPVAVDNDLQVFWRSSDDNSTGELQYEEIRKLNIFNPSSYRKKINLPIIENFALINVKDDQRATFSKTRKEINLELMPGGSIALEFGLFFP